MSYPSDLRYTEHDEWVRIEGDEFTIGITDYAQDALGELVHIEMPEVGTMVKAGEAVCEVESVKAVAEVYAPVAGEIVAVNEALDGAEDTVNNDPYGEGWLVRVRATQTLQSETLMDSDEYAEKVANA